MCVAFALVGLTFAASGIVADIKGWWESLPFFSNLFAGITSALFGIPFALLIIQRLSYRQAEDLQRRNVTRLKFAAANDLHSRTLTLLQSDGVTSICTPLDDAIEQSFTAVKAVDTFPRPHEAALFNAEFDVTGFTRCVEHSRSDLAKSVDILHELLPPNAEVADLVVDLGAKWRFLDEYVKPQIYETVGDWLHPQTFAQLHAALYEGGLDLSSLLELRGLLSSFLNTLNDILDGSLVISYDTLAGTIPRSTCSMYASFTNSRCCVQSLSALHEALNSMLAQLSR
jgi:hypothetical protein